ncbi:MAG: hypothetical protein ACFBSC_12960 [Microcoleaceae cyanobacterium]
MPTESFTLSPIYAIVVCSTTFAVIFGLIFKDMLEYSVDRWRRRPETTLHYKTRDLTLAYTATTIFTAISVASSMTVFIPIPQLMMLVGVLVVVPTALLIWVQLGSMLQLLADRGLEAVDLDLVVDPPATAAQPPNSEVSSDVAS